MAATNQARLNSYFRDSRKNDKRLIEWNETTEVAFEKVKSDFSNAATLVHPRTGADLRLVADASDLTVGAVLEQKAINDKWEPLAYVLLALRKAAFDFFKHNKHMCLIRPVPAAQ